MAYIVMAYKVIAYTVMAYIVMAYIVMDSPDALPLRASDEQPQHGGVSFAEKGRF